MDNLLSNFRRLLVHGNGQPSNILQLLFRHTDLMLALTDRGGKIVQCSPALRTLRGSDSGETDRFHEFLADPGHYDYGKSLEYIRRENKPIHDFEIEFDSATRAGKKLITLIPVNLAGESVNYVLHYVHDQYAEADAKTHLAQIEKLMNVGQIAAGIAHELNTPLGSIILSAGNVIETSNNKDVVEEATRIKNRAERCSAVVRELLGYVRQSEPGHQRFSMSAIVGKVLELTSTECSKRNITVSLDPGEVDIELACNVNQIEQVLFNLINNAIYAIGENGQIDIGIRYDSMLKRVIVSVRDDGKGIAADSIDKIFNPFYTTKPGSQGTGLGLAICKKIALEYGGDITVSSKENEGSVFQIWLPRTDD